LVQGRRGWGSNSSPSATVPHRLTAFPPSAARNRQGLYAIVTHSGVTLAPALGRFAADEILTGARDPLLAPYHPDRPTLT
jgi:glycine/D-amino acid oxidase-like deaminating enzyme